jgi:FkbM family methyltransferase
MDKSLRNTLRDDLIMYLTHSGDAFFEQYTNGHLIENDGFGNQLSARMALQKYCAESNAIESRASRVVFDVGCNIESNLDNFTSLALSKLPNCTVHGFDPLHWRSYKELYGKNERVKLHKIALSDKDCSKKLYSPSATGLSSFSLRKAWQTWPDEDQQQIQEKYVKCRSIDSFSKEMGIDYIDYLKLDCEGAELEVLLGASRLVSQRRIGLIQVEDQTGFIADAGFDCQARLCLFLEENGYEPVAYDGDDFVWRLKEHDKKNKGLDALERCNA